MLFRSRRIIEKGMAEEKTQQRRKLRRESVCVRVTERERERVRESESDWGILIPLFFVKI